MGECVLEAIGRTQPRRPQRTLYDPVQHALAGDDAGAETYPVYATCDVRRDVVAEVAVSRRIGWRCCGGDYLCSRKTGECARYSVARQVAYGRAFTVLHQDVFVVPCNDRAAG